MMKVTINGNEFAMYEDDALRLLDVYLEDIKGGTLVWSECDFSGDMGSYCSFIPEEQDHMTLEEKKERLRWLFTECPSTIGDILTCDIQFEHPASALSMATELGEPWDSYHSNQVHLFGAL